MAEKLYADEHLPVQTVYRLRTPHGHDVLTVRETNEDKRGDGDDDQTVLNDAIAMGRAVVTENCADFLALHRANSDHCGIIACKASEDPKRQAKLIDAAIKAVVARCGSLDGQFIRVPFPEEDPSRPTPFKKRSRRTRRG